MRVWVLSDLHLEIAPLDRPLEVPDADVCVMAGDLCRGAATGVRYLSALLKGRMPGIYVAGNHEYWGSSIAEEIEDGRKAASERPGIHFLENEAVILERVTFIGCTLWTDFRIQGHRELAMMHARERMNDYRRVPLRKWPWKRFVPEASARLHDQSRAFIASALDGITERSVIVTHHLPHPRSVPHRFEGDLANAAYASDLSDLIESGRPSLWVHGHTHDSCDYRVGPTRVVCNPRGYPGENRLFDQVFVVNL